MNTLRALSIALLLTTASPAIGQDLLGPLQDFVDTLTERPAQRPTPSQPVTPRPTPPVVQTVTPPPLPRPRPPVLPDLPTLETPAASDDPQDDQTPPPEADLAPQAPPAPQPPSEPQPDRVYQAACPAVLMGSVEAVMLPPLSEGACGEQSPLQVSAIMSRGRLVPLSSPVTTNCQMASALPDWLETVDGYAQAMLDSPIATINTGTSYMCRNRVGGDEGFMSEHGFANALDIVGFTLSNGEQIGVEADWAGATEGEGRLLRLAHDAACAGFTTVLGPEANAEHHDHLHLDLGCHGASCTARICQ